MNPNETRPEKRVAESDDLPRLKNVSFFIETRAPGFLDSDVLELTLVIDASVILPSLYFVAEEQARPGRTDLAEALDSGVLSGVVPPCVVSDVEEKIRIRAAKKNVALSRYENAWTDLRSRLKVIDIVPAAATQSPEFARDPDDAPLILLARAIGADGVLTADKDIAGMGGRAIEEPAKVLRLIREHARARAVELRIETFGVAATGGSIAIAGGVVKIALEAYRRFPRTTLAAAGLLALGAALALLFPPTRRRIAALVEAHREDIFAFGEAAFQEVSKLVKAHEVAALRAASTRNELDRRQVSASQKRTVRQILTSVLAAARKPLSLDEIDRKAFFAGYRSESRSRQQYLQRVLRSAPFEEPEAGTFLLRSA